MTALEKFAYLYKSAADFQQVSNWFHTIVGYQLIIIAGLILLQLFKKQIKSFQIILPIFIIVTNIFLIAYGFLEHGLNNFLLSVETIFSFPEFYIHTIMGIIAITGSTIELLYQTKKIKPELAAFAFPITFIITGYLFILHPQTGTHDEKVMFIHSIYGSLFIFSGIILLIQRLIKSAKTNQIYTIISALSLLILGVLLTQFRESNLAYQTYFPTPENKVAALNATNQATIYITQNSVTPQNIKIQKGGQITFYQLDSSWHDIASGPHPTHTDYPPLNIGYLKQGESKTVTFTKVGNFGFHDHIHETDTKLQGKIEVYE